MEDKNVGLLLAAFVMIILGVALIGVIASQTQSNTVKKYASETISIAGLRNNSGAASNAAIAFNQTVTIAQAPTGWEKEDCPITDFVFMNQTGTVMTLTTDYLFTASTGILSGKNVANLNSSGSNLTTATYRYCDSDYLNSSFGRTTLDLVPGFFAIALLLIGVGLAFSVLKNEGLINI